MSEFIGGPKSEEEARAAEQFDQSKKSETEDRGRIQEETTEQMAKRVEASAKIESEKAQTEKIDSILVEADNKLNTYLKAPGYTQLQEFSQDALGWLKSGIEVSKRSAKKQQASGIAAKKYAEIIDIIAEPYQAAIRMSDDAERRGDYRDEHAASVRLGEEKASRSERAQLAEQELTNYFMDRIKEDPSADPNHIVEMQQIANGNEPQKASKIAQLDARTKREHKFGSGNGYLPSKYID